MRFLSNLFRNNSLKERNIKIGVNNKISEKAIIHESVTIGNNNVIEDYVVIHPNTKIGDNNKIFPYNIIGEYPINSNIDGVDYSKLKNFKGVVIGNNNLLHVNNIIFSGCKNPTFIGNNNLFLAESHVAHDVKVFNNVTFYPRIVQGGFSIYLDYSSIGMGAVIQQRTIVGQYSMIGANNAVTKHVFPYFININNKIHRLNKMKIPLEINDNEAVLKEINENFKVNNYDISSYNLNNQIKNDLNTYIDKLKLSKE